MKKLLTIALAVSFGTALAQKSDNVGIGTTKPDPSALLDLNSTSKGLLLPRMSEAQRNAIKNPAAGLVIFQTDQGVGTYTYDGTTWQPNARTAGTLTVGAWDLRGSDVDAGDFLGTKNNFPLVFKVNNTAAGKIDQNPATASVFLGLEAGGLASPETSKSIGIGYQALKNSYSWIFGNVAIGHQTLVTVNGADNLAIGTEALKNLGVGNQNVAMGQSSMKELTSGDGNLAFGALSMKDVTSANGTIAIGRSAGSGISGDNNIFIGYGAGPAYGGNRSNTLYIDGSNRPDPLIGGDFSSRKLGVNTSLSSLASAPAGVNFMVNGAAIIGNITATTLSNIGTPSGYNLYVANGILTEKVKVSLQASTWADYVFEPKYHLMPLDKVEEFIKLNKHLPNVPSALEMEKNGLDVVNTNAKLLEKIEELTLYVIQLNKELNELKKQK